jgi:hypothetical protein
MSNIEEYITDHLDEFDSFEPEPGHFKRFEDRLQKQHLLYPVGHHRSQMLKVAAVIILMITVSVFVFEFATREFRERMATDKRATEMPAEIKEAVQYYDNQANMQITTLDKLAANHEDARALNTFALKEINSLDATTNDLKKSLAENPGNERILDAIVRTQQMKEAMLKTIITQISNAKK